MELGWHVQSDPESFIQLQSFRTCAPSSPLAHLSIAGEVRLSPCGGAAPPVGAVTPKRWPMADAHQLQLALTKREAT